jgi:hypothetical protein
MLSTLHLVQVLTDKGLAEVRSIGLLIFQDTGSEAGVWACCIGFIVIVILAIVAANNASKQQVKALAAARDAYYLSLANLKTDPANADLRQRTLQLGRTYSNLTRNKAGVTVFDEIALMNDINAACASTSVVTSFKPQEHKKESIEGRLSKLSDLRSKGLIDEQEYESKRQKILDEI